jgi:hypothetical protein
MPEIAKEPARWGASGIQTLYMTGRMKIDRKNVRDGEPVRRLASGS